MPTVRLHPLLQHLHGTAFRHEVDGLADGLLLERFLAERDQAAFAALVRRHGPMVLGVCQRILGNVHDAEDAFQATFLVLVRNAARVQPPGKVAGWLHSVACRTSLEARRLTARRRLREASVPVRAARREDLDADLRTLLDRELTGLPEKYRLPVVLCDLEGQSRAEAARRLGCPEGTVSSRLARARQLLARRLARHGFAPAGAVAVLTSGATACVPPSLVVSTVQAALGGAAAGVAPGAVLLMERVVQAMWMTKLKFAAASLAGVIILGALAYQALAARQAQGEPAQTAPATVAPVLAAVEKKPVAEEPKEVLSVKELPPVVVQTVPRAGETDVDADKVTEIKVTFSKDMKDKTWSWSQVSDESFPRSAGKPSYEKDKRTCVLPVKLEPGKTYVIWVNSEKFAGFKDADGRSAVPYLLVFETRPEKK